MMALGRYIKKLLGGVEDLLLDATLPDTVEQTRAGNTVDITKINARTIPVVSKLGELDFVSVQDKFDDIDTILADNTLTSVIIDDITNLVGADHIHYKVRNNSGVTIPKDTVVAASGIQPGTDYILIEPITDPQTQIALGITTEEIANNSIGMVTNTGVVTDIDTSAWTVGTILYPNTSGGLTTIKPTTGRYQACAIVLRQHSTQGTLLVEFTEPTVITLVNIVEDTTPQLGGDLDLNGHAIPLNLNIQTGTTYTAVLSDAEKIITLNNASAITMTIPANASVAYPIGTKLNFMQLGVGQVTIAITTDILNKDSIFTSKLNGRYAVATAVKVTSTSWVLFGNLELV